MKKLLIIGTFIIGVFFGCSSGDSGSGFDQRGYSNTDKLVSAEWLLSLIHISEPTRPY